MCNWILLEDQKPPKDSLYLVYAPSQDPDKLFLTTAWYNPEYGWSLLPSVWIEAITHWAKLLSPTETYHSICSNCESYRTIENGLVLQCEHCGNDEYKIAYKIH